MGITPISRRLGGFCLLHGSAADSHDYREREKGAAGPFGRDHGKTSVEILRMSRDTQARVRKESQGDELAGITSL